MICCASIAKLASYVCIGYKSGSVLYYSILFLAKQKPCLSLSAAQSINHAQSIIQNYSKQFELDFTWYYVYVFALDQLPIAWNSIIKITIHVHPK